MTLIKFVGTALMHCCHLMAVLALLVVAAFLPNQE